MEFIPCQPPLTRGVDAEFTVWKALKGALQERSGVAFWRFPLFLSGNGAGRRKEADILIIDREWGIVVVEVKGYEVTNIVDVRGHEWEVTGRVARSYPYQQAEGVAYTLANELSRASHGAIKPALKALIAVPNIVRDDWPIPPGRPGNPANVIVFGDELSPSVLPLTIAKSTFLRTGGKLDQRGFQKVINLLCGYRSASHPVDFHYLNRIQPTSSMREAADLSRRVLRDISLNDFALTTQIPPGYQQIRGIAGSGKTVLLCQKAAIMHLENPDWQIAIVFFTRSLYAQIELLVDTELRRKTAGECSYITAKDKIQILHGWGAKSRTGLYREACYANDVDFLNVRNAQGTGFTKPTDKQAYVAQQFLQQCSNPVPVYDAILLDEAQDFVVDNEALLHEGRQPFFWLARQLCKACDSDEQQRRFIWAFDEAQSLSSFKAPIAREVFGERMADVVTGIHAGGIPKSRVIRPCYRNPKKTLLAAFALGSGLYRGGPLIIGPTQRSTWADLGFHVTGQFHIGQQITISRTDENCPNPLGRISAEPQITFARCSDMNAELNILIKNVRQAYAAGLKWHEIALLCPKISLAAEGSHRMQAIGQRLNEAEIPFYQPGADRPNVISPNGSTKPDRFSMADHVTLSLPFRAKGNEVEMAFVIGLDLYDQHEKNPFARNQLYVCMTRARCWTRLSGVFPIETPFLKEIEICNEQIMSADEPTISFSYKGAMVTRNIEDESEWQQSIVVDYDGQVGIGPIVRRGDTVFQGDIVSAKRYRPFLGGAQDCSSDCNATRPRNCEILLDEGWRTVYAWGNSSR